MIPEARDVADRVLVVLTAVSIGLAALSVAFAAAALALRALNTRKERRWTAMERDWERLLLDVIAGDVAIESMRARVRPEDERYFVDYLSRFASRLRGAERATIEQLAAPYLPSLTRQLRSRSAATRARAVRTLSLLGLRAYSASIVAALDDTSPIVAMTAARALCQRDDPHYAPAVLYRIERFLDWNPVFLATMLANVGADAVPYLTSIFANQGASPRARAVAGRALRLLHDATSTEVAARILRNPAVRDVTVEALRLIRQSGNQAHAAVVRPLTQDPDPTIRAQAIAALGTVGDASDRPALTAALEDDSVWVVTHASRALMESRGREVVEGLAHSPHRRSDVARQVLLEYGA